MNTWNFQGIEIPWGAHEIAVSPEEFLKVLATVPDDMPRKPKPPLKRKVETRSYGFFGSKLTHSEREYDHHAPEYLAELETYHNRMAHWQRRPFDVLEIYAPWCAKVRIFMKGHEREAPL